MLVDIAKHAGFRTPGLVLTESSMPMVVGGSLLSGNNLTHVTVRPSEPDELL